ncbi:MAG: hypothetical protein LIP03_03205 [Bacteroidales bacterium]|nr:hypothetical protein [Bacteroidales bacterium]
MHYIDYVEYAGHRYKCRVIDAIYGDTLIGPLELEEKLLNEQGTLIDSEAERIDEQIFYYLDGQKLKDFDDDEIIKVIIEESPDMEDLFLLTSEK